MAWQSEQQRVSVCVSEREVYTVNGVGGEVQNRENNDIARRRLVASFRF